MLDPFFADASADLNQLKVYDEGVGAVSQNTQPGGGGDFYLQIGNMNEDLLRDGRMNFENGLPTPTDPNRPTIETAMGRAPGLQPINQNFDSDPETRSYQDVGYEGLSGYRRSKLFAPFLAAVNAKYSQTSRHTKLFLEIHLQTTTNIITEPLIIKMLLQTAMRSTSAINSTSILRITHLRVISTGFRAAAKYRGREPELYAGSA